MPVPTPLHRKTSEHCRSLRWGEWAGCYAVERYGACAEDEYFALRERVGLLDVSPLYKYDLVGPGALALVDRLLTRDAERLEDGQVACCCWCDEEGKVIDDGTVARLHAEHFRITAANPSYGWFTENAEGLEVEVRDVSRSLAAVALQGPASREVLRRVTDAELGSLRFCRLTRGRFDGFEAVISRTGFTGDLGYEIWVEAEHAERLWDRLMEGGRDYRIQPVGLLALDMARIEAGFVVVDVDYRSSLHCHKEDQKSSPYEIGLGWTVHLDKARPFVGEAALRREKERGSRWGLVGLEIDVEELEWLFERVGLPLSLPTTAWRGVVPLYDPATHHQVGRATSGVWSPLLKKYLALGTVRARYARPGTVLRIESLVDDHRHSVAARVVEKPFFDPPRKEAMEG